MVADGMGKFGVMFKEIMQKLSIMPWFFLAQKLLFNHIAILKEKSLKTNK